MRTASIDTPETPARHPADGGSPRDGLTTTLTPSHSARSANPGDVLARFERRMRTILEDPAVSARAAATQIRVRIDIRDAPGRIAYLLFDQPVPVVGLGDHVEAPTVRMLLAAAELDRLFDSGSSLAMLILSGDVVFEGPLRKLLRVMPILRGAALVISGEDEVV